MRRWLWFGGLYLLGIGVVGAIAYATRAVLV